MAQTPGKNLHKCLLTSIIVLTLVFTSLGRPAIYASNEDTGIKVYCNGKFRGSTAFIDDKSSVGMVPLALIEGFPGLRLNVRDNQAWFAMNGRQLTTTIGSNIYIMDGQEHVWRCGLKPWKYGRAVPARDLFEALGARVEWDGENRAIYISSPVQPAPIPNKVTREILPLHLAFTHEEQLWLLEADKAGAEPQPVSTPQVAQIIGWSHDGQWLAYLQYQGGKYSGDLNLWVVGADGQQPRCLDERLVVGDIPVWSPVDNSIAYTVRQGNDQKILAESLEVMTLKNGEWHRSTLLQVAQLGNGLTWFPDGQSLAISRVRSSKEPPAVDRVDLQGQRCRLFTLPADHAGKDSDGIFVYEIARPKLSPDGRYLAYFLALNSGSLNADGMSLQIVDLQNPQAPFTAGGSLGYKEWLAWSSDSKFLACILGGDRLASSGKKLTIIEIQNGMFHVKHLGQNSMVDARPIWVEGGGKLLYAHGTENDAWENEGRHQEVRVPGQQIWINTDSGARALSNPGSTQADYPLSLSPDGKNLVLQRQDYADLGSLYLLNLEDGQLVKFIENVQADSGYYGNYYPDSISIYWLSANFACATSPNKLYRAENYGVDTNITSGGKNPMEGIRLVEALSGKVLWNMTPGYYDCLSGNQFWE